MGFGDLQAEHIVASCVLVLGASFFLRHLSGLVFENVP